MIPSMTIDPGLFEESERMAPSSEARLRLAIGDLDLELGGHLPGVELAYQTWGTLNADRSNAVLVCHAISGDSNATGWWPRLVGPGLAIDTERYFVVCSNVIGGCQGSTGPSSTAPDGRPFGSRFPAVTIGDMVRAQNRLREALGVSRWALVAGGSMGGMQALEWAAQFGDVVERVWASASAPAHSAMQIGFNEVARQSILRDPKWRGGDYPTEDPPREGLAVARMLGHLTYLSPEAFAAKFERRIQEEKLVVQPKGAAFVDKPVFEVENYLNYQGEKFTERFDANTFLVVSNAIDRYVCSGYSATTEYLWTSFTSDWIYPSERSRVGHEAALAAGCRSTWLDIESPLGHDAFLLENVAQTEGVRRLLGTL